jgi:hypothetical protein
VVRIGLIFVGCVLSSLGYEGAEQRSRREEQEDAVHLHRPHDVLRLIKTERGWASLDSEEE